MKTIKLAVVKANGVAATATEAAKGKSCKYWHTYGDWEGSRAIIEFDTPVSETTAIKSVEKLRVLQENLAGYSSKAEIYAADAAMSQRNAKTNAGKAEETRIVKATAIGESVTEQRKESNPSIVIPEENKHGDCYQQAWKFAVYNPERNPMLVHGIVTGRGPIEGLRYNHAWVEIGDVVYDKTIPMAANGIPKQLYYSLGNIVEPDKLVFRYTLDDVLKKSRKFGTYGPWEDILWKYP